MRRGGAECVAVNVVRTIPGASASARLREISSAVARFVDDYGGEAPLFAVEGFARGARFRREEMGMVTGAVIVAMAKARPLSGDAVLVPPRAAKMTVCPDWYGWSRAHWDRAKMGDGKFKMSMPAKAAVQSGLLRLWGVRLLDEHAADAAAVALTLAVNLGLLAPKTSGGAVTEKQ